MRGTEMKRRMPTRGGRGGARGGAQRGGGRGGMRGGAAGRRPRDAGVGKKGPAKVVVVPYQSQNKNFDGVFIAKGSADLLVTRNMAPGESVYSEKRIMAGGDAGAEMAEYRVWNPFRSKLGAAIVGGVSQMPICPGAKVLYLGAANGTTVSHVSDIVGPKGVVYAVEFSNRSGRDLANMAKKRCNIVPIIEDARMPLRYRMLVPMVDVIFADVAQPDQSRIVALNAQYFLKVGGHFMISLKASCVDSTVSPETIFASEIQVLRAENCRTREQLSLEPYHRDHSMIIGQFRGSK